MQNMIGMLASSFGIPPQIATTAVNGLTQMLLQKSTPKAASGLLSALPQEMTNQINDNDKQKLTSTQVNVNRYDLLKQLSGVTGIKDIDKLDEFADAVLDSIKKNANINVSDGLDKEEAISGYERFVQGPLESNITLIYPGPKDKQREASQYQIFSSPLLLFSRLI